ncbi:alpha/beta hydrolase [Haloferula chungangensis]|uniref:Alpha/beta hydrolase n=1 Tax=Haloferula chungangensis TaxID=1048331 RepID=A0ABW2L2F8_9BACT
MEGTFVRSLMGSLVMVCLVSCGGPKPQWLMPTPVLYLDGQVKPFDHLPARDRHTSTEVFYLTNRKRDGDHYSNGVGDALRFGVAHMEIGEPGDDWETLVEVSTTHPRPKPMPVRLVDHEEISDDRQQSVLAQWAARVDGAINQTETRELILYVHGAKVGFQHSCAFAAELSHFAGRDFTPVAFDWPTHQEIFSYIDGADVDHARRSAARLAETLEILAARTSARRIHVVSWSAGARVLSRAMVELAGNDVSQARRRCRLGNVVFAASDVPRRDFVERLPAIHGLSDRVLVYMSDDDSALRWAPRLMGGGPRLGLEPRALSEEEKKILETMARLEVVDSSYGKLKRGFDITGHRYWFQHPWVNSDLILALRTGAGAKQRGLTATPLERVWYFGTGYSDSLSDVGRRLTDGQW